MRLTPLIALVLLAACGSNSPTPPVDTGSDGGDVSSCHRCVATTDCTGHEECVELAPSSVCAAPCLGNSSCAADEECSVVKSATGQTTSVCLPRDNSCGTSSTTSNPDAGMSSRPDAGQPQGTPALVDPLSVGGPVTANIDPRTGGTMDRLLFAVVGDTRASTENDISTYPSSIIQGIYSKLSSANPRPAFVIGTGDYAYASPSSGTAGPQYKIYLQARSVFPGPFWPAMGNHECNGSTTSNCFPGDGSSQNIDTWISDFLAPIGESKPYFVRNVNATNGSWTAKFIFLAPNSWDSAQASFLKTELAKPTTYTFVIRHEPSAAETTGSTDTALAPGVTAIDSAVKGANVTAMIEGHSHTWYFYDYVGTGFTTQASPKEAIIGNGGAPMTSTKHPYGFTVFSQRLQDNAIVLGNYDYSTGQVSGYYYAITPSGTEIQYRQ